MEAKQDPEYLRHKRDLILGMIKEFQGLVQKDNTHSIALEKEQAFMDLLQKSFLDYAEDIGKQYQEITGQSIPDSKNPEDDKAFTPELGSRIVESITKDMPAYIQKNVDILDDKFSDKIKQEILEQANSTLSLISMADKSPKEIDQEIAKRDKEFIATYREIGKEAFPAKIIGGTLGGLAAAGGLAWHNAVRDKGAARPWVQGWPARTAIVTGSTLAGVALAITLKIYQAFKRDDHYIMTQNSELDELKTLREDAVMASPDTMVTEAQAQDTQTISPDPSVHRS